MTYCTVHAVRLAPDGLCEDCLLASADTHDTETSQDDVEFFAQLRKEKENEST